MQSTLVWLYDALNWCFSANLLFKALSLQLDHAELLGVMVSLLESHLILYNCWLFRHWAQCFVCFVALRPSQQLWSLRDCQFTWPHFFLGKLEQAVNQYLVHILSLVAENNPAWMVHSAEGRRMTTKIISWSISTKEWDRAIIEPATPGSAVRHASVGRIGHVVSTWECQYWP